MCGICGYVGPKEAASLALEGIEKLEYRGYDSAGLAAISNGKLMTLKEVGKVLALKQVALTKTWDAHVAISHTRWATHGKPTVENAHPHFDGKEHLALVHNGIIENHDAIRKMLVSKGESFQSETDTEVISKLIGYFYDGDLLAAVQKALPLLKGAFALAVIHQDHPGQIVCSALNSPLAIGLGVGEMFVASDANAFAKHTKRVIYLADSEVALVTQNSVQVFDKSAILIEKECVELGIDIEEVTKGAFSHFMQKEIHEQPQSIQNALLDRYCRDYGTAILEELTISEEELKKVERIIIVACGTAAHAGLVGAYMLEECARIPVQVEISSEFRYKNPIIEKNTLAIAISQSGETADTLAAIHELKEKRAKVIGICNVQGSTISRKVDDCLFLRAGPEISVASTKAFTSMITLLSLLTLRLARMRQMSKQEGIQLIDALTALPEQIKTLLEKEEKIAHIAQKYAHFNNFFFIGRRLMYPTALEAALKLKETTYINANGYPAGEMKHGPIALIDEHCPTVAFCADSLTYPKLISNLMEVKARNGKILAIAPEGAVEIESIANDVITIPFTHNLFSVFPSSIAGQLLAYHIASLRGTDIDQPRNLAKSVTVE